MDNVDRLRKIAKLRDQHRDHLNIPYIDLLRLRISALDKLGQIMGPEMRFKLGHNQYIHNLCRERLFHMKPLKEAIREKFPNMTEHQLKMVALLLQDFWNVTIMTSRIATGTEHLSFFETYGPDGPKSGFFPHQPLTKEDIVNHPFAPIFLLADHLRNITLLPELAVERLLVFLYHAKFSEEN